jgi:uncharacterized protein (TIGR02453 family)
MIPANILAFLHALKENNSREWFHANKPWYQQAKNEFDIVTTQLIALVNTIDPEVGLPSVNDCTFRIFRDTRFSNNKEPYKNNFGAYVNRGGKKSPFAGYYLHLEPGGCFLAGGIYLPEPKVLNAVRQEIYHLTDEFKEIIHHPDFISTFGQIEGEKLKTAPKGYDKEWPDIDLLRYKSYSLMHYVGEDEVTSPHFADKLQLVFGRMKPMNDFINRVVADLENE